MSRPSNHPTELGNLENYSGQLSLFSDVEADMSEPDTSPPPMARFSDFVVYVDESGDHGMMTVDPNYPVFVLAFCVFHKRHYCEKVVPSLQKFKFNYFGHDHVVVECRGKKEDNELELEFWRICDGANRQSKRESRKSRHSRVGGNPAP